MCSKYQLNVLYETWSLTSNFYKDDDEACLMSSPWFFMEMFWNLREDNPATWGVESNHLIGRLLPTHNIHIVNLDIWYYIVWCKQY